MVAAMGAMAAVIMGTVVMEARTKATRALASGWFWAADGSSSPGVGGW